jgi:CRP-like cAMP-binding protein/Fe-S-cluster-containing hydrogenase component 2
MISQVALREPMQDIMKARKKDTAVKPPARLDPHDGDFDLPPVLYLECGVFKRLKMKPSTDKFPGTLVLRKFRAGEILCSQGDPGWTAFAILTAADIVALAAGRDKLLADLPGRIEQHIAKNKHEEQEKDEALLARLRAATLPPPIEAHQGDPAHVVGVYLDTSSGATRSPGWLARLFGAKKSSRRAKKTISVDAPTTIDQGSRKATMNEGSLFGQWSCIYGTPRSATIVADRDCYVLEMLRNVLDSILRDKQFQEDTDKEYRESVLQNHLASLSFFADLTPEQFAEIRAGVQLRRYKDGEAIFSRGDESTSMYIVRRGVVKVLVSDAGGESVLTYLSQGDFFGEIGVVLERPRSATCVAYVHPRPEADEADPQGDKWRKDEERIELVEIPAALFRKLHASDPALRKMVDAEIDLRAKRSQKRDEARGWEDRTAPTQSDDFQKLGLIQGQKLMLIDLDRCTRCDECVQACISTHSDGRTRLFLDGPRFGQYLIPTTCRSCRDPVCMIGCPVGSIRRGDNLQIVIEDWCIGCQLCAKSCPYGSIQMHDLGLIKEQTHGWRFQHASGVSGNSWTQLGFDDRAWMPGATPFLWDRDMEALLPSTAAEPTFAFRYTFTLDADLLKSPEAAFKLSLDSAAREVVVEGKGRSAKLTHMIDVWLNGTQLPLDKWTIASDQFVYEFAGPACGLLRAGKNVIAAQATGVQGKRVVLLQVALDEVRPSGAVLPLKAVVCDQCSTLPGQMQACVHACPHDAAKRVDAWTAFPAR